MEIKKVKYDNGEKTTYCYIDFEYHDNYEAATRHAKEWGWKLREVSPGKVCENLETLF